MHSRRPPADEAAARRLALIAAGAGGGRSGTADVAPEAADDTAVATGQAWWADHTRVADRGSTAPVAVATPRAVVPPPVVPAPGRHAARRRPGPIAARVPGLPSLAPAHVAVVAVVVALGLAVTTWWVVRDDPGPAVAPVSAEPVPALVPLPSPTAPASSSATGGPGGGTVTVDVAGKVRRPGIVVLDAGARVTDALEAAGGARKGVDLTSLNLARVLVDGEQVVVGRPGPPAGAPGPDGSPAVPGAPAAGLVNLNLAGQAELETLPGVGPVTGQAIIAWREQHGGFTSVDELLEVDGIGEKTLARLAPLVTV
ncbi:competence protein ComEA [Nocardioides sp. J9]|uniref:helix-hairpin-helix domain-containing protein n=1 Tax=Nocardioides sp. J9 TaxID=935844 RepID=UPI0011A56EB7|nr:helix-hairpin-helix domain-containing protein [Nocardioides sp. J9]TWG99608.1 competence protein ComEA [Nocardioides sp. J9]